MTKTKVGKYEFSGDVNTVVACTRGVASYGGSDELSPGPIIKALVAEVEVLRAERAEIKKQLDGVLMMARGATLAQQAEGVCEELVKRRCEVEHLRADEPTKMYQERDQALRQGYRDACKELGALRWEKARAQFEIGNLKKALEDKANELVEAWDRACADGGADAAYERGRERERSEWRQQTGCGSAFDGQLLRAEHDRLVVKYAEQLERADKAEAVIDGVYTALGTPEGADVVEHARSVAARANAPAPQEFYRKDQALEFLRKQMPDTSDGYVRHPLWTFDAALAELLAERDLKIVEAALGIKDDGRTGRMNAQAVRSRFGNRLQDIVLDERVSKELRARAGAALAVM